MFSRSFFALAILAISAFAAPLNLPDKRDATCEVSDASPSTFDAQTAARVIIAHGSDCCQDNRGGSLCTTMVTVGTAAVGLCGPHGSCFKCTALGTQLLQAVDQCSSNSKSGGQFPIPFSGNRLIITHA